MRARESLTVERAALAGALLFVAYVITRYDVCFQDAEILTGYIFDDGERARLLDYAANILTLETRLMLWTILPPHPSMTPVWLLTLLAGPVLLYRFLHTELDSRRAALAGVAVYLVSAGCLSGVTMLFHQAKPLANVAIIATFYLSSRINAAPSLPYRPWIGLLSVLAAAPLADETAAFAFAIPLVWCPQLFWIRPEPGRLRRLRHWAMYAIPAVVVVVLLLVILPPVFGAADRNLDLLAFLQRKAAEGAPYGKLDLRHIVWQGGNLLLPGLLPWQMAAVRIPVADGPALPGLALIVMAAVAILTTVSIRRRRVRWGPYRKLLALTLVFVVFQSVVIVFHPQELSATGYYYGAIFSVLFAALIAVAFADCSERPGGRLAACVGLAWVVVVSALNYLPMNASWNAHSNFKALANMPSLAAHNHGADTSEVMALAAALERAQESPSANQVNLSYASDIAASGPRSAFGDALYAWRRWRQGDPDFLAGQTLSIRNLWIAVELDLENRREPRRWRTLLPWR